MKRALTPMQYRFAVIYETSSTEKFSALIPILARWILFVYLDVVEAVDGVLIPEPADLQAVRQPAVHRHLRRENLQRWLYAV